MIFIQFTGLSGAGKSSIAHLVKMQMEQQGDRVEVIDADVYRPVLCPDLGYSKESRMENIRRLGFVANLLSKHGVITILAAINPYESVRNELVSKGTRVKIIWIKCNVEVLIQRDTKGLYRKAMLPDGHPEKIYNLTGVNDDYEPPLKPDLIIDTDEEELEASVIKVVDFIRKEQSF
jgi:adenylylsulfate kinase